MRRHFYLRFFLLTALLLIAVPQDVEAWIYDDRCADKTSTEFDLNSPNALMMLDRSGSMAASAGGGHTLWSAAVNAINEVTGEYVHGGACNANDRSGCDSVRFGLGLFYTGRQSYRCRKRYREYYTVRKRVPYRYRVRVPYTVRVRQAYMARVPETYWTTVRQPYRYRVRQTYTYYVNVRKRVHRRKRVRKRICQNRCHRRFSWGVWKWVCSKACWYTWRWVSEYSYKWVRVRRTGTRWVWRTGYRYRRVQRTRYVWKVRYRWVTRTRYRYSWRTGSRWVTERRSRWAYRWDTCHRYGDIADVTDPVREDNRNPIMSTLRSHSPGGGTPTGAAAKSLYNAADLKDRDRVNVGILITDGYPSGVTHGVDAVDYLCRLRERNQTPADTYVLGFSSGTNTHYNNFLAAAGGTGRCCPENRPNCGAAFENDPCNLSASQLTSKVTDILRRRDGNLWCEGSYQANYPEEFKAALVEITNEVACTFKLDLPGTYTDGKAYEDPEATTVRMYHSHYGWLDVPHMTSGLMDDNLRAAGAPNSKARQYTNEGWVFADSDRTKIKLTTQLCDEIAAGRTEEVTTQVACACPNYGETCQVNGTSGVCGEGTYGCDIPPGREVCEPNYNNDDVIGEECEISGAHGRCAIGHKVCNNGQEECEQLYRPMPEVCNGLDDDCDGVIDNLSTSSDDFDNLSMGDDYDTVSCYQRDLCTCSPDADNDHLGDGSTPQEEFDDYLDGWTDDCTCGESFSY